MSEKIVLTKQKIQALQKELEKLEKVTKKDLSQSLEQARLSDVSEDTDDIIAVMSELEKVDHRINEIKDVLSNASELKKSHVSKHKIGIGCEVKLKNNDKTTKFHIVSEIEADPTHNKISDKSPLGKELLKAKVGDCVKIEVGNRKVEYKVLSVD